jgi:hypothetical protein
MKQVREGVVDGLGRDMDIGELEAERRGPR